MSDDAADGGRAERVQRALAQGVAAVVGWRMGGPLGAISSASLEPFVEPLVTKVFDELRGDAQRRHFETLAAAQQTLGVETDELERLVLASEGSRLQAGIALSAATRTTWSPKLIAVGRALAAGLMGEDDTRIDTQPLIMAALADIEFPQASLLELLVCRWPMTTQEGVVAAAFKSEPNPWTAGQRIWLTSEMVAVRPTLRPVLPSLLGTLQRHGLVIQSDNPSDPFGQTGRAIQQRFLSDRAAQQGSWANLETIAGYGPAGSWLPTELGQEVINALLAAGAEFAT